MRFEFATAGRIIFGAGSIKELAPVASSWGRHALCVAGKSGRRAADMIRTLADEGIQTTEFNVTEEPTVAAVLAGLEQARAANCEVVISMGGGSVIDAGKAIAALFTNPGSIHDYLEVVGKGQALRHPSLPFVAIPTTSGTGSEVTRNAVLGVTEKRVKVSLRSPLMLPRLAIVDPELTYDLPKAITAASGLDALAQLIEPFVSIAANPMVDALCREGMQRIARSIRRAYEDGSDAEARADMALASLFSGMALANAKLGAVHGFAGAIGGMFAAPHGAICGRLLPAIVQANVTALRQRKPQSDTLNRFNELGRLLTGRADANAAAAVVWLQDLCTELQIPSLSTYGITPSDFPEIIARSIESSSMKGNPVELSEGELTEALARAI